jgi:hypothetical protein
MFTSPETSSGALPPSSRCVRLTVAAAPRATSMPALVEPVSDTMAGTGCSTSSRPVSRSPSTTLNTPAGSTRAASVARSTEDDGVVSAGFSTTVLPAARAGAIFHTAIING